jgi:hypothetical protein
MTSRLDEIKARSSIVSAKPEGREPTTDELLAAKRLARRDVPVLVAAVEAVLELTTCAGEQLGQSRSTYDMAYLNAMQEVATAIHTALGEGGQ